MNSLSNKSEDTANGDETSIVSIENMLLHQSLSVFKLDLSIFVPSVTYGISSGRTSAMMLMLSVLAFDVGDAAKRIFNSAIIHCGRFGRIA